MDQFIMEEVLKIRQEMANNPVFHARWQRQMEYVSRPKTEEERKQRQNLLDAVKNGNRRDVYYAIHHGVDVNILLTADEYMFAWTLLGLAASCGHHNLIPCLVHAGIDIDDPGGFVWTPLHIAIEKNHVEFARKLLQEGANIHAISKNNEEALTALHLAVNKGYVECIKLLLEEKANIEAVSNLNYTPLHEAAMSNQLHALEILLDAGCNRNALMDGGKSALHVAAWYNNKEAAELLVKRGFDLELKDDKGHTPSETANVHGHEELAHWLDKLRKGKSNSFSNFGTMSNSELMTNYIHSKESYDDENVFLLDLVLPISQHTRSWEKLRSVIPLDSSGYYQDHDGHTVLHFASKYGSFDAVKCLIEELKIHPNLRAYNGDLPVDLARREGHSKVADILNNASHQKSLSVISENEMYEKLLTVISTRGKNDNVQEVSRLLIQGAPLESYDKTRPSALAMAILWNKVSIIELLLAAGAPLTVTHHGKTLLQVAWFSPDVTIRVKLIITRAYERNLIYENAQYIYGLDTKHFHKKMTADERMHYLDTPGKFYLDFGLRLFLRILCGESPWRARWAIDGESCNLSTLHIGDTINEESLHEETLSRARCAIFNQQMETAAKHNCKLAAFFIHQSGSHPNIRTELGSTPLHEALDANHYDLARVMVKHLGASLYIPDGDGRYPNDLMPTCMKQQLEKEQVTVEFSKLEESIPLVRSEAEKAEMKEHALILVCLYASFTNQWDNDLCEWQYLHRYLVSLIQVKSKPETLKSKCDNSKSFQDKDYEWVSVICKNLSQLNQTHHIHTEGSVIGFSDILSCIVDLSNSIRNQDHILEIIKCDQKGKLVNFTASNIMLAKSVKFAIEKNFQTFLHLLFKIGSQSLDIPLNDIIQSLPVHHAAAAGNLCAILYLTLTCGASVNVLDRNRNTPAHLSYMNGYKYVGDYICEYDHSVEEIKNISGQTPKVLREAFREYKKQYGIVKDVEPNDMSDSLTEQIDGSSLTTRLLKYWFCTIKSMNFRKLKEISIVDYSCGEARLVLSMVTDFARNIGNKITEYNPLLKGTLVPVGSAGDNVRLNAPDESDSTWILHWDNVGVYLEEMLQEDQNIKNYKHIIKAKSDDKEIQHLLEGTNLLEEFYFQCVKAVSDLVSNLDPCLSLILPGVKRIGCGVCITLAWAGTTYPMLIVKMDLVPAFRASRPANFPHPPLTKYTKDPRLNHIYVVQTHIQAGEKRCASTLEEQVVMQKLSSEQRLVFIIAKLLVSKLKTEDWASKHFKERFTFFTTKQFKLPAPTGFLLKSAFFKVLESISDPKDWQENCIVDRLKDIFYSMCKEREDTGILVSGLVPSYFSSTTQPPAAGFMAPSIYRFLVDNEEKLRKMEDSTSDSIETEELDRLALMWEEALNKYFFIP